MDFGDLKDDVVIQEKLKNFEQSVDEIEKIVNKTIFGIDFNSLTLNDKVNYDLFVAYLLNTCYWMYLRTKGLDPNTDSIKDEINRIKEYMVKAKQAHERNTIRPKINKEVADRFVKHGINHSKKRKFSDN